ncbi:hypothetical protein MM440_16720 [Arsenicicoccus piscis]|uniref:Uridine kinase n=1 Tax=Arsenicicoccus piscis TaxID=673954 RepID=A0ABQ6HQS5_9MICO|nr:hypothetical protein [Arsenicicoccus piscis]MCH8629367.1 hypothetical protein [Arsenicicoccus piscis]GMA20433.1 hypothetical protein GCM10025862_24540 [Arsenicicoccus piscis]
MTPAASDPVLHRGEPVAGPWTTLDEVDLAARIREMTDAPRPLVLVDGMSGAGKTTVADVVAAAFGAGIVHTDDVAWHLHPVDWAEQMLSGVVEPWRAGERVGYRPPGWVERDRPGHVHVDPSRGLVIEGVGAARHELAPLADLVIWVQVDRERARTRGLARDVQLGRTEQEAVDFWAEWERSELPFLERERPWARAHLVVDGFPPAGTAGQLRIADGPAERT